MLEPGLVGIFTNLLFSVTVLVTVGNKKVVTWLLLLWLTISGYEGKHPQRTPVQSGMTQEHKIEGSVSSQGEKDEMGRPKEHLVKERSLGKALENEEELNRQRPCALLYLPS